MIYSIGYQNLKLIRLQKILRKLDAILVDVRMTPWSRRAEFRGNHLKKVLGDGYVQMGHCLGGMGQVNEEGIDWIRKQAGNVILMCLEECPGDCHRHSDICSPYFPDALHIFGKELITAKETERLIWSQLDDYQVAGHLPDLR